MCPAYVNTPNRRIAIACPQRSEHHRVEGSVVDMGTEATIRGSQSGGNIPKHCLPWDRREYRELFTQCTGDIFLRRVEDRALTQKKGEKARFWLC